MTTPFPSVPDLEFLRKRAKDLLRGAQRGEPEALSTIRAALPRKARASEAELGAGLKLANAQHAVAREQGFGAGRSCGAALGWAVQKEREASVRLMVELGFDLAVEGPDGGTPLHWAAWHGRPRMVRLLLGLGAPVEMRDSRFGSTPLGWAAHGSTNCRQADNDYCEVVEALPDDGATADTIEGEVPPERSPALRWLRSYVAERSARKGCQVGNGGLKWGEVGDP